MLKGNGIFLFLNIGFLYRCKYKLIIPAPYKCKIAWNTEVLS